MSDNASDEQNSILLNRKIYNNFWNENSAQYEVFLELIEDVILKRNISYVMDIGCGDGVLGRYIRQQHIPVNIYGTDISDSAIEKSMPFYNSVYKVTDIKIPLQPERKYDLITMNSILEHMEDEMLHTLFKEIDLALNPAGLIFIAVPNRTSPHLIFADRKREKEEVGHVNVKTLYGWIKFLSSYGYKKCQLSYSIKLKHLEKMTYFEKQPTLRFLVKRFYPLLLRYPFLLLRDSLYITAQK